jgi:hypothetical protein
MESKNIGQTWEEYVAEMTTEELQVEGESLNDYFESCAETGDGISTKDSIRMRYIREELERRGVRPWWV